MSTSIQIVKAEFFRTLGHPIRVRILEELRDGERSVGYMQSALDLDASSTSQHLALLRRQGLLESRREGTSVLYRVRDDRIFQLFEVARLMLSTQYEETKALLEGLSDPPPSRDAGS